MMGQIKPAFRFYPGLLTALISGGLFAAILVVDGLAQEGFPADAASWREVVSPHNHIPAFMED
jgi:hypothetical protein